MAWQSSERAWARHNFFSAFLRTRFNFFVFAISFLVWVFPIMSTDTRIPYISPHALPLFAYPFLLFLTLRYFICYIVVVIDTPLTISLLNGMDQFLASATTALSASSDLSKTSRHQIKIPSFVHISRYLFCTRCIEWGIRMCMCVDISPKMIFTTHLSW